MRRILIFEREGAWCFERADGSQTMSASPYLASIEAHSYGESLRGSALGYIIRLLPAASWKVEESITLHQQLF